MKVLTLKQPWATLIAEGLKTYEFRSWKTNYRGKILIHAGCSIEKQELNKFKELNLKYPSKRIIAEAELVDCLPLTDELNEKIKNMNSIIYGKKKRTGYAWVLKNIKIINSDKEIKGQLGLWNIKDDYF